MCFLKACQQRSTSHGRFPPFVFDLRLARTSLVVTHGHGHGLGHRSPFEVDERMSLYPLTDASSCIDLRTFIGYGTTERCMDGEVSVKRENA